MNSIGVVMAGGSEPKTMEKYLYSFYRSIKNPRDRFECPFDFMGFQKDSSKPDHDEQYLLFAFAFLDEEIFCSERERLLLGLGALYSLNSIERKTFFNESPPNYTEVTSKIRHLLQRFHWKDIHSLSHTTFPGIDMVRLLSLYRLDELLKN